MFGQYDHEFNNTFGDMFSGFNGLNTSLDSRYKRAKENKQGYKLVNKPNNKFAIIDKDKNIIIDCKGNKDDSKEEFIRFTNRLS